MSTVREHLKKAIESGATQSEIEKKTGVSQATISRILSGEHADPRSSTVAKIKSFRVRSVRRSKADSSSALPAEATP